MVDDRPRPVTGASPRGPDLLPQERLARRICKLVSAQPISHEELKTSLTEVVRGATARQRRETGMQYFEEGLALALTQGWVRQREGRLEVTEAGALVALRTRSDWRRPRYMSRIRP